MAPLTSSPASSGPTTSAGSTLTPGAAELSPRELEVLRLIAAGEANGDIAATLGLSVHGVERHAANIYRKIDARGRADATAWALRNGVA